MKKIKFPLFMLAICIALAASFAFTLPAKNAKAFDVYHYSSDEVDFAHLSDPDNWQGPDLECEDDIDSVPCAITCGGDLGTYLLSLETAPAIIAAATTWRTQP